MHEHCMINTVLACMQLAGASAFRQMCGLQPIFAYGALLLENLNCKQTHAHGHALLNVLKALQLHTVYLIKN